MDITSSQHLHFLLPVFFGDVLSRNADRTFRNRIFFRGQFRSQVFWQSLEQLFISMNQYCKKSSYAAPLEDLLFEAYDQKTNEHCALPNAESIKK